MFVNNGHDRPAARSPFLTNAPATARLFLLFDFLLVVYYETTIVGIKQTSLVCYR